MYQQHKIIGFQTKILLAFAVAYLISWVIILAAIYVAFNDQKEAEHARIRVEFQQSFDNLKIQRTNALSALLEIIARRQELQGNYTLDKRAYLYNFFKDDFSQLKEKLNITHLYIADGNRQQILRVHSPQRYGDRTERYKPFTQDTQTETLHGIYLGKRGSMTHRVMKPIMSHNKLEGIIELGEEIDVLWQQVATQFNASIFILIEKKRLKKENWQEGRDVFDWPGSWDDLQSHVLISGTSYKDFFKGLRNNTFNETFLEGYGEIKLDGTSYIFDHLPLMEKNLGQVGTILIAYPQSVVTEKFWKNLQKAFIASAIAMLLGMMLCYLLLRPITKAMEMKQSELEVKVKERTTALNTAKEAAETEKNKALIAAKTKSDFLSNMSHELRTPLNAIIGFSSIVMNDEFGEGVSDRYKSYAEDINKSGSHLLDIINDILDVSRIEAGEMSLKIQKIAVPGILEDCQRMINMRATQKGVAIINKTYDLELYLDADPTRLKQILLNLLTNAVKFTAPPGSVFISAAPVSTTDIKFTVKDEGCGIAQNEIPEALKRFGQAPTRVLQKEQEEGTGLGLALVQDLIKMHNGTFSFESVAGEGTCVSFTLPIHHDYNKNGHMI